MSSAASTIKQYIVTDIMAGQDAGDLTETTPLVTTGVLDSMALLKLVLFLEEEFSVSVEPDEATAEKLDTIAKMVELVSSKTAVGQN